MLDNLVYLTGLEEKRGSGRLSSPMLIEGQGQNEHVSMNYDFKIVGLFIWDIIQVRMTYPLYKCKMPKP